MLVCLPEAGECVYHCVCDGLPLRRQSCARLPSLLTPIPTKRCPGWVDMNGW